VTLSDHVKPLLFVAPHDVYLLEKRSTNELLVIHGKVVWLAISNPGPVLPRLEFIINEWGDLQSIYPTQTHVFDSDWCMKTWLNDRFMSLKAAR
jgi:hypothetical protein